MEVYFEHEAVDQGVVFRGFVWLTVTRTGLFAWSFHVQCMLSGAGESRQVWGDYWESHTESQEEQEMIERVRARQLEWRRARQFEALIS